MRYFAQPTDPFAVVNHPWQPFVAHAHLWTSPLLVFAVGLIWRAHALDHWRRGVRRRRRSGFSLLAGVAPMVASGYFIQTAVDETWRTVWVAVHVSSSLLWGGGYLIHQVMPKVRRRRGRRAVGGLRSPWRRRTPGPEPRARVPGGER